MSRILCLVVLSFAASKLWNGAMLLQNSRQMVTASFELNDFEIKTLGLKEEKISLNPALLKKFQNSGEFWINQGDLAFQKDTKLKTFVIPKDRDFHLNKAFSLFIAFKINGKSLGDLLSFGDCKDSRFLIHAPMGPEKIGIQFGSPEKESIIIPYSSAANHFIVLGLIRNETGLEVYWENSIYRKNNIWKTNIIEPTEDILFLGNSPCGNSFEGIIRSFFLTNTALLPDAALAMYKHFAAIAKEQ